MKNFKLVSLLSLAVGLSAGCGPGIMTDDDDTPSPTCTSKVEDNLLVVQCSGDDKPSIVTLPAAPAPIAGSPGEDGEDAPLVLSSSSPATSCANGGTKFQFFQDDGDGVVGIEDVLLSESEVCNGSNGSDGVAGNDGADGSDGVDGSDGISLVSSSRMATLAECSTGGSAVDIYADIDASGTVTLSDSLQAGLVACNGAVGAAGTNGTNGTSATMVATTLSSQSTCYNLGDNIFVRRTSNSSSSVYTSASCSSTLASGFGRSSNEVYSSGNILLIWEGSGSSTVVRKLVF